jgi:hypothetical protein
VTSPIGGSEHVTRYRALGEFDSLIRAAREARQELRKLRDEEAKLNSQSMADDKKVAASKKERAKAEQDSASAASRAMADLSKSRQAAAKAGQDNAKAFSGQFGTQIETDAKVLSRTTLDRMTKSMNKQFADSGKESAKQFNRQFGIQSETEFRAVSRPALDRMTRILNKMFSDSGKESGRLFAEGLQIRLNRLNTNLGVLRLDPLELDVSTEDAHQAIKALEFELKRMAHEDPNITVRFQANKALTDVRGLSRALKDELGEDILKETVKVRKELEKIDALPSGKSFRFWALTALSDMARVFEEADRGTSIFERLRRAAAAGGSGGGGGNFLRSFVSGFDEFSESTSRLLQRLSRVSGELYRMPGVIAVLVSSLPALISGIGALGGATLGLSSALGATMGVLAAAPGVIAAFGGAIGAVTMSIGGFEDIFKAARKAQAEQAEAAEKSRLGTEKALTATQKYNLLLKELDPSTRKVTEAFIKFSDEWVKVSQAVGENFFKEVVDQTDRLNKLLPIAQDYFSESATAVGKLADQGIRMLTSGPWKRDFAIIARNNAEVIENMGGAGFALANVFRNIAVAAAPFTGWLTRGLREGAEAFADWSAEARSNGTISAFLGETQESLQSLWQILKNLGNVVNSFFASTVDEGQRYLSVLEEITQGWADVAAAQEDANSPLRQWMTAIRPILSSLGALIGDLARGIADLADDQSSIDTMVALLDSLRTDVLPPILDILRELNESGIAVTVTEALGDMLTAIATFLESGATQALTVFVSVLANFVELLFNLASLPGVSDVIGGIAMAVAALAAVSIVARFSGLFKLWDFFNWMTRNRGNLSGAFSDAARGVAGLQTNGPANIPNTIPSSVGVGSEVIARNVEATRNLNNATQIAATRTGLFARAMEGLSTAGSAARGAVGSLVGLLGGPWGIAIGAAIIGAGLLVNKLANQKKEAEDTKNAFVALKNAYTDLSKGDTSGVEQLAETNEKFKEVVDSASQYGVTLRDVSGALQNQDQSVERFNTQMDRQINSLKAARDQQIAYAKSQGDTTGAFQQGIDAVQAQIDAAETYKNSVNGIADANTRLTSSLGTAADMSLTYQERLAGLTQAQVDSSVEVNNMDKEIRTLSNALDTMSSATATSEDRARALGDIIASETGEIERATEATEIWSSQLLGLEDSVKANGKSLSLHTREGLRNRDALQAAAKATRDLYLEDIAAGVPMDEATKKHTERIKALEKEAGELGLNRKKTQELIGTYKNVPESVQTNILTDANGFAKVFADLKRLQVMQQALKEGKSMAEAERIWRSESSGLYQRPPTTTPRERGGGQGNSRNGDGYGAPGFRNGGPVWGAGTRTSDSIRAWLSNGEFVQPTDAVEHYGMPLMEAIRNRKLDKVAIQEALPDMNGGHRYASGGSAHSSNCVACASGGHKFAQGGRISVPISVNPRGTLVDKDWATAFAGSLGNGGGPGGYRWQMNVLRQQFPGLPLWSGYRPGSTTLSGNRSYHSLGRAVDLPPRRDVAAWIRANYGSRTKELITPFNDLNLWNGRPHRYSGAVWNQHNFAGGNAHNHWAFNQGGLVDVMKMLGMNNFAPQQSAPLPSAPRTLSPAASAVVNNSADNTTSFGDIIINNPTAERGGDSIRNALYRTQLLL